MPKKRRSRKGLARYAEAFAASLLWEASGGSIGKGKPSVEKQEGMPEVSFRDRRALLDSITKLLSSQGPPTEEDDEDGIDSFRERLNGRSGEIERGTDSASNEDEASSVHRPSGSEEI